MIKPNFVLCCTGSLLQPKLDICIWATTEERAKEEATAMAVALDPSNYYNFRLFNVSGEQADVVVGDVMVTKAKATGAFV